MAILNYLFLMIVLKDVHQHCVITRGNSLPEGTHCKLQPYHVHTVSNS